MQRGDERDSFGIFPPLSSSCSNKSNMFSRPHCDHVNKNCLLSSSTYALSHLYYTWLTTSTRTLRTELHTDAAVAETEAGIEDRA